MPHEPDPVGSSSAVDDALAKYFRRLDQGDQVDQQAFLREHAELAEQLREYFSYERNMVKAEAETAVFDSPSKGASSTLKVRCPHCHTPQSISVDASLVNLLCTDCGATFSLTGSDSQTAETITRVGHFELLDRLGVGGFGSVWKARDTELDRVVAVKLPRRGGMTTEETEKFLREARAAAQLSHPNIVAVHEVGRHGETVYIVSDLVRGVSMADWLADQKPTGREVAVLASKIAGALQHAHDQGVVHRDLKPGNILIDGDGEPHLVDFGLARREAGEVTMTVEGQILGTPAYMSPEQARGDSHEADRRSDIYSLGVVLFELLTGELPFRGNIRMLLHQIIHDEPPSPRKFNGNIPKDLETITLRCLEKELGKRFQTAVDVRDELRRYLNGEPILSRPLSRLSRANRWAKRNPMMATVAGLVVFLAVAGPLVALRFAQLQWSLQERLSERDSLMRQSTREAQRSALQLKRLEVQLAAWEGKANPWDLWPPKKDTIFRRDQAVRLLAHVRNMPVGPAGEQDWGTPERAFHFLALAALTEALGKRREACKAYEAACEVLAGLDEQTLDSAIRLEVLADCQVRLSRLHLRDDRAAAERHANSARELLQQLAAAAGNDPLPQIALLEAEVASQKFQKYDAASEALSRILLIKKKLPELLPSHPEDVYRVACYLANVTPVLLDRFSTTGNPDAVSD